MFSFQVGHFFSLLKRDIDKYGQLVNVYINLFHKEVVDQNFGSPVVCENIFCVLVKRAIVVTLSCINHAETSFRVYKGWFLVADEITARSKNIEIGFDSFATNSIELFFKQLLLR